MLGGDTKISKVGTMRIVDLMDMRKTEKKENQAHIMEGTSYHLKGAYHSKSALFVLLFVCF